MMQITHEVRPDHLLVLAAGDFDLQQARAGLGEALRESQARGITRILVDGRGITTQVSIADRYDIATQLATYAQGRLRIAIVAGEDNMFTKTLEDTARNRGVNLVTTDSMRTAREYLGLAPD
jgi:hypothetical protein